MKDALHLVLESIVYGDDARITPADRLKAAEQLQIRDGGTPPSPLAQLTDEEVDAEWDRYMAADAQLLLAGQPCELVARMPHTAAALRAAVEAHAEGLARDLADAARLDAEVERRAEARAAALYRAEMMAAPPTTARETADAPAPPAPVPSAPEQPRQAPELPPGISPEVLGRQWPARRRPPDWVYRLR